MEYFNKNRQDREQREDVSPEGIDGMNDIPIVVYGRTGLSVKDDALTAKLSSDSKNLTVGEVLDNLIESAERETQDQATSIQKALTANGTIIMANGRQVAKDHTIGPYLLEKAHVLDGGDRLVYHELDLEISAVHEGGYRP